MDKHLTNNSYENVPLKLKVNAVNSKAPRYYPNTTTTEISVQEKLVSPVRTAKVWYFNHCLILTPDPVQCRGSSNTDRVAKELGRPSSASS